MFGMQIDNRTVGHIIESIMGFLNDNIYFNAFSTVIGLISFVQEFLERYREKTWRKLIMESAVVCMALAALCKIWSVFPAVFFVSLLVFAMTFCRRKKYYRDAKANLEDRTDQQVKEILEDAKENDDGPKILDLSGSAFKNAVQCLAEKRPKAAICCLNNCREKEKKQLRFVTRYVDALIMLGNYKGALAKLNDLTAKQVNKKKRYKSVMIRKAACYYSLNMYMEELDCCDKVIASNYKPQKYYYYRGKIKTRLLEKYSYIKAAEKVIFQKFRSKEAFIESALGDFDKSLSYGDKYKAKILSYKGSCYFHLQEKQKALDLFYESESITENFENNYVYFGIYYYEEGNLDAAKMYLEKGITYGADDEVPSLYLARISYQEKMYDKAILYAAKALSICSYIDECYGIQGDCYKKKNMNVEAIACYTRAIGLSPKEEYFKSRAVCYYNKRDAEYKKAYDDMQEAVKLNDSTSNRFRVALYRAAVDETEGRKKELSILKQELEPYIAKASNYGRIGQIFSKYGYLDEAEEYYKKGIEYDKEDASTHYNLAIILYDSGRVEEAASHLETAVEIDPINIKYCNFLEKCYSHSRNASKEMETQSKICRIKEKYMMVNKENGDAVYRLGKYHSAEAYYRRALEYVSKYPAVLNNLACTLYYQERYEEAVVCLQCAKTQETKPNHVIHFNLGNCYLRTGDRNSAAVNYKTAQKLSAEFDSAGQMLQFMDPSKIEMELISDSN